MSTNILLIFAILIYAMPSLANELCRNGTGYLSMLNQTKIISNFTNENGNITILVDQDSEFNFTCHNNNNSNKTKILFVSENPDPFLVKCDGVCQVNIFKVVLLDAGSVCENNSTDWNCSVDKMEEIISESFNTESSMFTNRMPMGPVIKTYKVIKPPNLNCDSSETLFGLSSCFDELNLKEAPIEVLIEIKIQDGETIYIKEQYWPPMTTNSIEDNSSVPTWVIIICIALALAVIAIFYSTFQNLRFKAPGLEP